MADVRCPVHGAGEVRFVCAHLYAAFQAKDQAPRSVTAVAIRYGDLRASDTRYPPWNVCSDCVVAVSAAQVPTQVASEAAYEAASNVLAKLIGEKLMCGLCFDEMPWTVTRP